MIPGALHSSPPRKRGMTTKWWVPNGRARKTPSPQWTGLDCMRRVESIGDACRRQSRIDLAQLEIKILGTRAYLVQVQHECGGDGAMPARGIVKPGGPQNPAVPHPAGCVGNAGGDV